MPVFATDTTRFSAVVKHEYEPQLSYCRESAVINDSAATLKVGTVMGKVTATGKWKVALSAAVDGSQNPAGILIADGAGVSGDVVVANATDTNAVVLTRGPAIVADGSLVYGTGITAAAAKTALQALGIMVETSV